MNGGRATLRARLAVAAALAVLAAGTGSSRAAPPGVFVETHCAECHDDATKEGGLDLTALVKREPGRDSFATWVKVHDRLREGEMPPKKREAPPPEEKVAFLAALDRQLHDLSAAAQAKDGRALARRLNRDEYQNSLRDLLGIEADYRSRLPEDGRAFGFDKVGSALSLSAEHLEAYLEVARAALDETIATGPAPEVFKQTIQQRMTPGGVIRRYNFRFSDQPDALVRFTAFNDRIVGWEGVTIPGTYRFRIRARGWGGEPVKGRIIVGGRRPRDPVSHLTYAEFPPEGTILEVVAYAQPGEVLRISPIGVAGRAGGSPVIDLPFLPGMEGQHYLGPGLAIEWVEIEGPLMTSWPKPGHRRLFGDLDFARAGRTEAERVLREFLPRAFRRPIRDEEIAPYLAHFDRAVKGQGFAGAIKVALQAALCSPHFLFLRAPAGPLDDYALAARLAYFLWSSLPDDELNSVARAGKLRQPDVLRRQAERMLGDPRAAAFTVSFTNQWLDLRRINATTPDERLYPEWDELLEWSAVEETRRFFDEVLRHDLPVTSFVQSPFAMLNERLAAHYGIAGVRGMALRKVSLPPDSVRGGVLAQASILKVTANGTTTSPVTRGVWVLERMLGQHVPPPPQNVPAIEPDIRGATNIRQQLAKHRGDPQCAACHAKIDPPGFALERFDVVGGWRERYRATTEHAAEKARVVQPLTFDVVAFQHDATKRQPLLAEVGLGSAVDASGQMANGAAFGDYPEFRRTLLAHPDQLTRALAEHLVVYATGAGPQYADRVVLEAVVARMREHGGGFRALLHEIVQSPIFLRQ